MPRSPRRLPASVDPSRADAAAWIFAIAGSLRIGPWRARRDRAIAATLAQPPTS